MEIKTARQLIRYRNIMLGLPIPTITYAKIPFGYEVDPDNTAMLRPVQKQLEALWAARLKFPKSTYPLLAEWVSEETGRYISFRGLQRIFNTRPPLEAYLLPLHDRINIATALTEKEAIEAQPPSQILCSEKSLENRKKFERLREGAVSKAERIKAIKSTRKSSETERDYD